MHEIVVVCLISFAQTDLKLPSLPAGDSIYDYNVNPVTGRSGVKTSILPHLGGHIGTVSLPTTSHQRSPLKPMAAS